MLTCHELSDSNRPFSHDGHISVQTNGTAAMLVYRKNPEGIKTFLVQQICIVNDYVSENDLYLVFLTLVHLSRTGCYIRFSDPRF